MGYLEKNTGTRIALDEAMKRDNWYEALRIVLQFPEEEKTEQIKILKTIYNKLSPSKPGFWDSIFSEDKNDYSDVFNFLTHIPNFLRYEIVPIAEYKHIGEKQITNCIFEGVYSSYGADYSYGDAKRIASLIGRELSNVELEKFLRAESIDTYQQEIIDKLDSKE